MATSFRPKRAMVKRPGCAERTRSGAISRALANRGRASTPSGRRLDVPTLDRASHLTANATATVIAPAARAVQSQ